MSQRGTQPAAVLQHWNRLPLDEATTIVLPCNGSRAWAVPLAQQRPFGDANSLLRAADTVWHSLDKAAWQQAFDSHPRIGERHAKAATTASLQWSADEQRTSQDDVAVQEALAEQNQAYEERFGRIFLVCATGKSAAQMLAILQSRLRNSPEVELQEAVEQQRRITQLRLRKWLRLTPARCEEV